MKRILFAALTVWACTFVRAELKVHFTFEDCSSAIGNHTGTLHDGAKLTTVGSLPVLSLGANNGYFDMGASVGKVIATLQEYVISVNVYIPETTTLGGAGNFIYTFANSTNIKDDANGCIFLGANGMRYAISPRRWEDEQAVEAGSQYPKGQWHTITYLQDESLAALLLDGSLIASGSSLMTPNELGATPYNFLGRPCYTGDAYLKDAMYSDFRIYDNVDDVTLNDLTQYVEQLNRGIVDQQVTDLMNKTTLDSDTYYGDILLPMPNENGVTVTWESSDESIVTHSGGVTRPAYGSSTARVTLTATFSKEGISKQKSFIVYIPAHEMSDDDIVDSDMASLILNGHLENLATNLYLPTRGEKGSHISWESSHPSILSNEGELLSQRESKTDITLTATISLRNSVATNTFYITVAKKLPLAYYLFAYFNGNAQWQEQICFALSTDGYNYTPLNNGDPIINSADIALKQAVRDPHILRGEDGYFYMVVTDMRSDQGWASNDGMVLLRSKDMVDWTHTAIDFPTRWPHRFDRNTLTQVWAPQTIYDPEEGKYMVYYAIGESGKNYITYYSYANEDFTDLTEPKVLYDHNGMNTIDADIVWHDGKYHMFFKTEGQGNGIQKATAKTLRGEWTPEYQYLQQTNAAVEGSGVFEKIDSDEWVLMYDCYTSGMYQYCTSTDLSNFTWVCNSANTNIFTPRHGTTIAITAEEAQRLAAVWPSEGLNLIDWVDITDDFIKSPRFDDNSSAGWTVEGNAVNKIKEYNTMEFWNGTFNLYQTINVPNGKYRLSVQSFYTPANNENGYLYANNVRQSIKLRNSEYFTSKPSIGNWQATGTVRYVPNDRQAGSYCFEQGMYNNSLEVEVTDGTLTFGLICDYAPGANWCMFDNFKLEHFGAMNIAKVEEIRLSHTALDLTEGDMITLTATPLPEDAVNKDIIWYSYNSEVASVDKDGTVRALKGGETTIIAIAADGSGIAASCEVKVASLGDTWFDVTDGYIVNPYFDNGSTNGWTISKRAENSQTGYGGMEFWNGEFEIYQSLNAPNGKYRISVQAYYRTGDNSVAYPNYSNGAEEITAFLYANNNTMPIASIYSESLSEPVDGGHYWVRDEYYNYSYYPNSMEFGSHCFEKGMYNNQIIVDVTDGTLTFGIYCNSSQYSNWCMMDNFKLEYYGQQTPVSSISLSSTSLSLTEGESATLTATISPTNATYQKVAWSSSNPNVADVDEYGTVTAYQNGSTTIYARATDDSGISASCRVSVTGTIPSAENIVINEVQTCNIDMFVDPSFNYGGWMELYNPTDKAVSLNSLYISDDAENLTKYNLGRNRGIIPAKGYHVLWFDHYNYHYSPSQIDFKLDYDGGSIYLSDTEGNLITSFDYPVAITRTSYARTTDGGEEWSFTARPTPGESNTTSTFANERLATPIVSEDACLFTSPFTFNVEIPEGATLRYTTDGTTPTLTNGETSTNGQFSVSSTTTYRFALFQEGMLPSQVVTRSYIYRDKDYTLPIISVVTDPVNLYDDILGVYVQGTNGRPGNGQSSPCNWNMDWDRPVNFEYITPDCGMVVNQEVDFAMCGGWSRAWSPHSFKLKAGKIYEGLNSIDYPFFADKPYLKHKTLQIRNGGNDTDSRIKDAALQEIVHRSGLDVDGQATQPVHHFINGEYKGMLNMREPNNKHFAYANWGIDSDEMDQFEMSPDSGYVQMEGDREAFLEWYNLSADAADDDIYEEILNLVDIDEYINYMAVEFYLGGNDWPQNNIKGFRPRIENGRFRFVLFDLDGTLATTSPFYTFEEKQTYTFDHIYDMGGRLTEEIELVTIFLNMLQNDSFRKQFIDTYCLVAGSVFDPERCNAIIDEMAARTAPALALEGRSPYWTSDGLKSSLSGRQNAMINALIDYYRMGLTYDMKQSVSVSANVDGVSLRMNDQIIPTGKFNGSLFSPVTLKAEPKAGYRFVGWSNENGGQQSTTLIARGSSWSYYDKGSLDGKNWTSNSYSTSSWETGNAPLGYFTSDAANGRGYNTILDYGTDANAKRPTYYFHTMVTLSKAPSATDVFKLNYTVDDGMVVYVNGQEAARYLMPNGEVTYTTYSSTYANSNPDSGTLTLDASLFKRGSNVIAIEVHNCDNKSSDIYFDVDLVHFGETDSNIVSRDAEYTLPSGSDFSFIAIYEPLTEEELEKQNSLPIRINEISADNSIYINEYYKKNDWVELYNTTSEPVDVAGMYLSDNINKPTKYQISGADGINTIIAPHDYLIIWPDKLTTLTQLHASFKLDADGGEIVLTSADQTWNDILSYEPHLGTESVGLYPDGSNDVYVMTTPTIAKSNVINSYAKWLEQSNDNSGATFVTASTEEDLLLSYHDGVLHIYGLDVAWSTVTIYSATGKTYMKTTAEFTNGKASVNLTSLPAGIYVAAVSDSNGELQTLKIRVH